MAHQLTLQVTVPTPEGAVRVAEVLARVAVGISIDEPGAHTATRVCGYEPDFLVDVIGGAEHEPDEAGS